MKALKNVIVLLVAVICATGCMKDTCEREITYLEYTPVFVQPTDFRIDYQILQPSEELCDPGRIYYYNDYIFINEKDKGVHVINNTNPANPVNEIFYKIIGNESMVIQNGMLYANSYVDLLTIDISDINNPQLVSRQEEIFPAQHFNNSTNEYLIRYDVEEVTEKLDCETQNTLQRNGSGQWAWCPNCLWEVDFATLDGTSIANGGGFGNDDAGGGTGTGGSMARFTLAQNHLYVVDDQNLHVVDLGSGTSPEKVNEVTLGWGIETIIPYQDKLFIGSNSGMFIYDIANPATPAFLSNFEHARACDPVFVKDNFAYVTLRDGTVCDGFINQLDLVDVSNLTAPVLKKTFPLHNPHGLSIAGNTLFVCEGDQGIKSFDISDPMTLDERLLDHEKPGFAFDVIALPNNLLMIGEDGFYQFDYSDPSDLRLISKIEDRDCE